MEKNILIIKTGALGDVLRCTFIAQALKDKYPGSNISWITSEKAKDLFLNNPYVDTVLIDNDEMIKSGIGGMGFHLIINLEEDEKNAKFVTHYNYENKTTVDEDGHISGVVGVFFNEETNKVDYTDTSAEWFNTSLISKLGEQEADRLKKENKKTHRQLLCDMLNITDVKKYEPFLRLTEEQRKIASDFMRRHNLTRGDMIIGINTGAAERWPKALSVEMTAKLINQLAFDDGGTKIILFGGPSEVERNREIHKLTHCHIIDAGCGNDLVEFPALVSVCSHFITADTLGMHVALALKRPTISLLGATSPAEIDMYGLGKVIIANSDQTGTYRNAPSDIMDHIDLIEVHNTLVDMLEHRVTLLITAYKEKRVSFAVDAAQNQTYEDPYQVVVSAPDEETIAIVRDAQDDKYEDVTVFKDEGFGKTHALNEAFKKIDCDIIILTDGDVYISNNAIKEIVEKFSDPEVGCVTGRPIPTEDKSTKYGYWANFLFDAAHNIRKKANENNEFIECSGYLFAFRKKFIGHIPEDVCEDGYIPYYFWEKGFRVAYVDKAEVYVKNVDNFKDFMKQKTRTAKSHELLPLYVNTKITKRVKSFSTELKGIKLLFTYPKSVKEFWWTKQLCFIRLLMWMNVFYKTKFKKETDVDNWESISSTK